MNHDDMIAARDYVYKHTLHGSRRPSERDRDFENLSQAGPGPLTCLWYTYYMVLKGLDDPTDVQQGSNSAQTKVEPKKPDAAAADVLQKWLRTGDHLQVKTDIANMNHVTLNKFKELCRNAKFLFAPYENTANGMEARMTLSLPLKSLSSESLSWEPLLQNLWMLCSTMPEPEPYEETTQNENPDENDIDSMLFARKFFYKSFFPMVRWSPELEIELENVTQGEGKALSKIFCTYMAVFKPFISTTSNAGSDCLLNKIMESFQSDYQTANDELARHALQKWLRNEDSIELQRDIERMTEDECNAFIDLLKTCYFIFQPYKNNHYGRLARETLAENPIEPPPQMQHHLQKLWNMNLPVVQKEQAFNEIPSTGDEGASVSAKTPHVVSMDDAQEKAGTRTIYVDTSDDVQEKAKTRTSNVVSSAGVQKKSKTWLFNVDLLDDVPENSETRTSNVVSSDDVQEKAKTRIFKMVLSDDVPEMAGTKTTHVVPSDDVPKKVETRTSNMVQSDDVQEKTKTKTPCVVPSDDVQDKAITRTSKVVQSDEVQEKAKTRQSSVDLSDDVPEKTETETRCVVPPDDVAEKARNQQDEVEEEDPKLAAIAFMNQWAQMEIETPGLLPDFESLSLEQLDEVRKMCYNSPDLSDALTNSADSPGTSQR